MKREQQPDDVFVWDDGQWCFRHEEGDMGEVLNTFTVLQTETPEWVHFMEKEA